MMQHRVQGPQSPSQGPSTGAHSSKRLHTGPHETDCTEVCWEDRGPCCCGPCGPCSCGPCSCGPWDFSRSLPAEMTEQIFLQLDPQSLCRAAQTCRRWHHFIQESEALWRGQCLLLRAQCSREVERDRGHGHSWKVTLVRNFTRSRLKRDWMKGRFSCVQSANELRDVRMVSFDAEAWGEILQAELDR